MKAVVGCSKRRILVKNFIHLLQKCRKRKNLAFAYCVYVHICNYGLEGHIEVGNYLVPMLVECGSVYDAQKVFNRLVHKNEHSWTSLIQGYIECGESWLALKLFQKMQGKFIQPSSHTFVALLKACTGLKCSVRGRHIHTYIVKNGLGRDCIVSNTLVDMYAKCGSLTEAQELFDEMVVRNVVSWTALMVGYVEHGFFEEALDRLELMKQEWVAPDALAYSCSLKACGNIKALQKGCEIHSKIIKEGFERDPFICSILVDMYAKCALITDAQDVFEKLLHKLSVRDVASWTALIAGYAEQGLGEEALSCFEQMQLEGVVPNAVTFVCSLKACGSIGAIDSGQDIHVKTVKDGCDRDPSVSNGLVDMYGKCGLLAEAQFVFGDLQVRDVVSWTALIAGYANHGFGEKALTCLKQMQLEGVRPNAATFVCSLKACSSMIVAIDWCQEVHSQIAKEGLESDPFVGNTLVHMYAQCGSFEEAWEVFYELPVRDVVSWNGLITGYAEHGLDNEAVNCLDHMQLDGVSPNGISWSGVILGCAEQGNCGKAFELYVQMQEQGLSPNVVTILRIVKACGKIASQETGRKLHVQIFESASPEAMEITLANALVGMYGKCGSMVDAWQVFEAIPTRDIVTWNTLIAGYAQNGESEIVFCLFERMEEEGPQPDELTFLSILTVCSHAGYIDKGQNYFEAMSREYSISPMIEHHNSMVDLLGRAGQLDEAVTVLEKMPFQPDVIALTTMLGVCWKWNNVELGKHVFECIMGLDENYAAAYVLMSNI